MTVFLAQEKKQDAAQRLGEIFENYTSVRGLIPRIYK